MKTIKHLLTGIAIGLIIGLWFGVNIGKGHPFYDNPFKERSITKQIMQSGGEMLEKGGKALQEKVENR